MSADPIDAEQGLQALDAWFTRIAAQLVAPFSEAPVEVPLRPALPGRLAELAELFHLTPAAAEVLLLAMGFDLDPRVETALAPYARPEQSAAPTLALALRVIEGLRYADVAPDAPLRQWRLVRVDGPNPLRAALVPDERIVQYLLGEAGMDVALVPFVRRLSAPDDELLGDAAWAAVDQIDAALRAHTAHLELHGPDVESLREVAAAAAEACGLEAWEIDLARVAPDAVEDLARRWQREAWLRDALLVVDAHDGALDSARGWVRACKAPLIVLGRERVVNHRVLPAVELPPTPREEQRLRWERLFDEAAPEGVDAGWAAVAAARMAGQFDVSVATMQAAWTQARGAPLEAVDPLGPTWDAVRAHVRPRLDGLAEVLIPRARWEDLQLPPAELEMLRTIGTHVRHHAQVYDDWGFGARTSKGKGTAVLLAGPSGTGKTHGAEVLAASLRLDIVRVDLSAVMSKWIGETQKNLGKVFDLAETGGVILLFDEADALFGRRSEVKSASDRHANMDTSYLLQRMETFKGLSILTSNIKDGIDRAFLRRLRFVVNFPFPGPSERERLWRRAFPPGVPVGTLDHAALARLHLAGGAVRNVATNAAFFAAEEGTAVEMRHLKRAVVLEYQKMEQPILESEMSGWK